MKPINDRPTPFVDSKASIRHHAYDRDEEVIQANDARTLERMCAELAEALNKLNNSYDPYAVPGWEMNIATANEAGQALARYAEMMKGVFMVVKLAGVDK